LRAERIARTLKSKYGAEKVFLYGSLAWGGFREDSDIDLLVCGYQGSYWDILVEVERLASPFQVSLVGLEDASPSLRAEVFARGVPL
jgi:predicted nucleotidyltransferase